MKTATRVTLPRGHCAVCAASLTLTQHGRVRQHRTRRINIYAEAYTAEDTCLGSGEYPEPWDEPSTLDDPFMTEDRPDIHDAIDAWHDGDGWDTELHEYLGMTWEQYSQWAATRQLPNGSRYRDSDRPNPTENP